VSTVAISLARFAAAVTERAAAWASVLASVTFDEIERRLQERLDALGPAPRAELLHVLMLPDFERADRIGEFWRNPSTTSRGAGRIERLGTVERGQGRGQL
jgi:hypothetical protein